MSGVASRLERVPLRLAWADQPGASAWRAQVFDTGIGLDGFTVRLSLPAAILGCERRPQRASPAPTITT